MKWVDADEAAEAVAARRRARGSSSAATTRHPLACSSARSRRCAPRLQPVGAERPASGCRIVTASRSRPASSDRACEESPSALRAGAAVDGAGALPRSSCDRTSCSSTSPVSWTARCRSAPRSTSCRPPSSSVGRAAVLVIAQVNEHMPYTFGDGEFDVDDFDYLVEVDEPTRRPRTAATLDDVSRCRSANESPSLCPTAPPCSSASERCPTRRCPGWRSGVVCRSGPRCSATVC